MNDTTNHIKRKQMDEQINEITDSHRWNSRTYLVKQVILNNFILGLVFA